MELRPNHFALFAGRMLPRTVLCSVAAALMTAAGCVSVDHGHDPAWHDGTATCPTCSAPHQCATCAAPGAVTQNPLVPIPPYGGWQEDPQHMQQHGGPLACQPLSGVPAVPPDDSQARATRACQEKVATLQQQVDQMLSEQREMHMSNQLTMKNFSKDLQRLSDEVNYWKDEVTRMDAAAKAQHERDMKSLDSLIQLLEQFPVAAQDAQRPTNATVKE